MKWEQYYLNQFVIKAAVPVTTDSGGGGKSEDGTTTTNAKKQPRSVGRVHQLFIDDDLIESVNGLQRVVNQPVRHHENPVLTYEKPWEGNCVITWGSVL